MTGLLVAPCDFEAAHYAVMKWHYSKAVPAGKLVKFGVWENSKFIGVVIYGRGATPNLCKPYGLTQTDVCELVRVALDKHQSPVSQIVAETLRLLKKTNPGLRLVISFADPNEGHKGGIYKAGNWTYTGQSDSAKFYKVHGKVIHPRTAYSLGKNSLDWLIENIDANATAVYKPGKYRFVYPLDKQIKRQIQKMSVPYINAVEGLEESHSNSVTEVLVQSQPTAQVGK